MIGLGVVEAREDDELRARRQEHANRKYARSWLAICLPIAYCLLDAAGTFADSLVLETLKRYNREYGTTIIMVSSELEELRSVCDRVAIVYEGRIEGILPHSAPLEDFGILMAGAAKDDAPAALDGGH